MKTSIGKMAGILVLLVFFSLGGFVAVAGGEVKYTVTLLGTLEGGSYSIAYGINESGAIVGEADFPSGSKMVPRGFFWKAETGMRELGAFGIKSSARGINNAGKVVGYSNTPLGPMVIFTWAETDPVMKQFTPSGEEALGYAINDSDAIAGNGLNERNEQRGFRWTTTGKEDVGTLAGGNLSQAYSINDIGNVAGFSNNVSGNSRAFLWNGAMRELEILPGYQDSYANHLNNNNQVVGRVESKINTEIYDTLPNSQPFFWENGSMIGLGTLGGDYGEALGINDSGVVVGWSMVGEEIRAFIWDKNNAAGMVDLNDLIPEGSGLTLAVATAINNKGQIVGYGFRSGSFNEQAFLLTPIPQPVPQEGPEGSFEVKIDIRPWNYQNRIHLQAKWSLIPIAILSDADFNALKDVDRRSLTFGRTGDEKSLAFCTPWKWDLNHDRKKDLVCYFHERPAGFQCGDTLGTLKGKTLKGEEFEGQDRVQVGLCPPPKKHHHKK